MDAEILKLSKAPSKSRLIEFLNESSKEEITEIIKYKLNDYHAINDVDSVLFLRAFLQGSPVEEEGMGLERRILLLKLIVEWMGRASNEKSKQANNIITLLLPEIELFPSSLLYTAGTSIIATMQDQNLVQTQVFDLLSKIWNLIIMEKDSTLSADLLQKLISTDWNNQLAAALISSIKDMEFTNHQLETIVQHLITKLDGLETEEVPPFVSQLLTIFKKGCKSTILEGIFDYFNNVDTLSNSEGTVMLHIAYGIKQDDDMGGEFIKFMKKNPENSLKIFNMACLLTVARNNGYEQTIYDIIKAPILAAYKDAEKLMKCPWISDWSDENVDAYKKVLLDISEKSASGWDQVIQSLTRLSILLIDTASSQIPTFFLKNGIVVNTRSSTNETPMDQLAQLGIEVALRMFKYHQVIRNTLFEKITWSLISKNQGTVYFLDLLKRMIDEYPQGMKAHMSRIKDTLDHLPNLPTPLAEKLLLVLKPLCKSDEQLRSDLILMFKKSLISFDTNGSNIAVRGLLNILSDLLEDAQSQNVEKASHARILALEILSPLRRCFSQHADIRSIVYNGLGSLAEQYPFFAQDITIAFTIQFMRTFERESSVACPIRLDICVKKAGITEIAEPIHILTANLTKAMRAIPPETQGSSKKKRASSSSSSIASDLSSLVTRLSKATLEDFELDKSSSFDMTTAQGQRNNHYVILLLGLYEVAIEYEYNTDKRASEKIKNLFNARKQLAELQKEAPSLRKATHVSLLSLGFIQNILNALFMQAELPPSDRVLKSDINFVQMAMSSVMDSLKASIDDQYRSQEEQDFKNCVGISKALFRVLEEEDSDSIYVADQSTKKSTSVLYTASTSLLAILKMVSKIWPDRFVEYVAKAMLKDSVPLDKTNKVLYAAISKIKTIVQKYTTGYTPIYREAASMLQILDFISQKFNRALADYTTEMKNTMTWLDEVARERPLEDNNMVKEIMSQLTQACSDIGEFNIIHSIASDVHASTGDIDVLVGQTHETPDVTYQIINEKTCSTIVTQILLFLDQSFDDLIWCIGRLRSLAANSEREAVKEFDDEICRRLLELLFATSELLKALLSNPQSESLMRVLTKAYKTLLAFMKYKIAFPIELTNEFIRLIEYVASEITDKMYKALTVYGQKQEMAAASAKKGKRKERSTKAELQVVRQGRIVPSLIFVVEQFERHLIQLSRKSKVDLMQYMKRSTSRDFRIKLSNIPDEEEEDEDDEEEESAKKRTRLGSEEGSPA